MKIAKTPFRLKMISRCTTIVCCFLAALSLLTFFTLETTIPQLLAFYLNKQGGSLKSCEMKRVGMSRYEIPFCEISLLETTVLITNAEIRFHLGRPTLHLHSLKLTLPTISPSASPRPPMSGLHIELFPFAELQIEELFLSHPLINLSHVIASSSAENLTFSARLLNPNFPQLTPLRLRNINLSGTLHDESLSINITAESEILEKLSATGEYNIREGSGKLVLAPISTDLAKLHLRESGFPLPPTLNMQSGILKISGTLFWEALNLAPKVDLHFDISELVGSCEGASFSNLNLYLQLTTSSNWSAKGSGKLSVGSFEFGAKARDLALNFNLEMNNARVVNIELPKLTFQVFGGNFHAEQCSLVSGKETTCVLTGESIHLEELLLLGGKAVHGEGLLFGTFPLRISQNGIRLTDGKLQSLPPGGKLSYTPEKSAENSNKELQFTYKALENFVFEQLDASLNCSLHGTLISDLQLKGKNPHLFEARSINFNIHLEENLPALLKSMRVFSEKGQDVWSKKEHR